ncbi:MAG: NAD-dependent epimerase/dehydratase family protein [Acidimicrobiia bacterium]|nr:NAD-dependent epimerase/dehydratase family protein [Acidimicrobiia bacterium]
MDRVLVTGGTGVIGVELVEELCRMGFRPRVLTRRPHRAALLSSYPVEVVHGDLSSEASLRRALEDIDTVIHLGARASFESYRRLKPTIVDGTVRLGQLAADSGVDHFVYSSSLFVYGGQETPIRSDTPALPVMDYGRAKVEAEDALLDISARSAMTVANVRLPHVYGPQSILFQQVRNGIAIFPGKMGNRCGQLHVADAARILAQIGLARWTGSSAVSDGETVTWSEFFSILEELYPRLRLVTLPSWFAYAGATVLEPLASRRSRPTLYTKDTVVGFNLDLPVEPGLIWEDLGIEPHYRSVHEGIPRVLDGYVRYRWRHPLQDRRSA